MVLIAAAAAAVDDGELDFSEEAENLDVNEVAGLRYDLLPGDSENSEEEK